MIAKRTSSKISVNPKSRRTCIIVLGCHRSGTSAVTRCLSLLGAALPRDVMGSYPSNEAGHWEPNQVAYLNEAMLLEAGSRWNDWRRFDGASLGKGRLQYYKCEIRRIIAAEYSGKNLFVLKDPRICRFVGLYEDALEALGIDVRFVHVIRNPLEVAASLRVRDGLDERLSGLIWLRHVLDAEFATRDRPVSLLHYENLLRSWQKEIADVPARLELAWPIPPETAAAEMARHFRKDLKHHTASIKQFKAGDPLQTWLRQAYQALSGLRLGKSVETNRNILDSVKSELDKSALIFGEVMIAQEKQMGEALATANAELQKQGEALATANAELQKQGEALTTANVEFDSLWKALLTANGGLRRGSNLPTWRRMALGMLRFSPSDVDTVAGSLLFDRDWYLERNPDVAQAGIEPAKHYCEFGAAEDRPPGPLFDGAWYLEQNPDVAAARINPLVHFMRFGLREGRIICAGPSRRVLHVPQIM
jgi:hypothetical protein